MMYRSTRGLSPNATFEDVLLAGLAPDGGLYMPVSWPDLPSLHDVSARAVPGGEVGATPLPYAQAAAGVMAPFTGGNPDARELLAMASRVYAKFDHPQTAPVIEIGHGLYLLELFHGPTLAFKDFAMQLLALLMERALARRGTSTVILGATSGDTGAAAVEAFRGRKEIELFVLFPHGRISDVQRKQMTTAEEDNVHAIAIEGTFDDTQAIVKTLFGDAAFRERHALSAINSINWARIIAQAVYYYTASERLGPGAPPSFSVPTGNFGDIFAGYAAAKMGLPINRLVIATNENDILVRALNSRRYEPRDVVPTDSPSMDIQISSNFERLLFEESGQDAGFVTAAMSALRERRHFDIPPAVLTSMRKRFSAYRVTREDAAREMRAVSREAGLLIDPHTAVGVVAAKREKETTDGPMVVLGTAHPAKFPGAVARATGREADVPQSLRRIVHGPERYQVLPNSASAVADTIRAHVSRAART